MGYIANNPFYAGNSPTPETNRRNYARYQNETGKTVFPFAHRPGMVDLYLNRTKLIPDIDFLSGDGQNITLATPLIASDILEIYSWTSISLDEPTTAVRKETVLVATTANQTAFTANYNPIDVTVYKNGVRMLQSEYQAVDGVNITLNVGVASGTNIVVESWEYRNQLTAIKVQSVRNVTEVTATAGQTDFTLAYTANTLAVFKNGLRLPPSQVDTSTIGKVKLAACQAGDKILFEVLST